MIEDLFLEKNELTPDSFHSFIILCFLSLPDQQIRECNSGWRKVPLSTLRITLNWPENSFTAQLTKQDKRGDHSARHISFPLWKYSRLWRAPEKNEMEEKNNKCDKRQKHISPDDEIKLFDASPMSNPIYGWNSGQQDVHGGYVVVQYPGQTLFPQPLQPFPAPHTMSRSCAMTWF